ncbi:MAG: EcsC family protein [Bacteroidaceae bacterium]|nr:EcsC family protein [Bacteroidaceae bacterium]
MELNQSIVSKALSTAYDKAINGFEVQGIKVLDSAYDLAKDYINDSKTLEANVTSLINWQCGKSAISGFVTNLGGLPAMAVGLPANLTSVLYIQLRMVAAIALMAGFNPKSDQVQTLAYACLTGSSIGNIIKNAGIKIGEKVAVNYIKKSLTREVINKINSAVSFRLLTKFGEKGIINAGKFVPFVGGGIGGAFDAASTKAIGNVAKNLFVNNKV